jgi:choline kinase
MHAIIPAAGMGRRLGTSAQGGPKSLMKINDRPLLLHTARLLAARKVQRLTVIVGYRAERFAQVLGTAVDGMSVDYVLNRQYDTTEHGYSMYCAREAWREHEMPVLFMDADNAFAAALLDRLLDAPYDDCVLVDPALSSAAHDEELVLGAKGLITGFVRGRSAAFEDCVGGFVGMNRFSTHYMRELFNFMDTLFSGQFAADNHGLKYERVFDRLARERGIAPHYLQTATLDWVNVNRPQDLPRAAAVLRKDVAGG